MRITSSPVYDSHITDITILKHTYKLSRLALVSSAVQIGFIYNNYLEFIVILEP